MTIAYEMVNGERQNGWATSPVVTVQNGTTRTETQTHSRLSERQGLRDKSHGIQKERQEDMRALCTQLKTKVDTFLAIPDPTDPVLRNVQRQVRVAMGVIEDALGRYRPEDLALSYNGGKDCLVLLILILACLPTHYAASVTSSRTESKSDYFPTSLQALYIRPPSPFLEVDTFVAESTKTYNLDLTTSDDSMKPALAAYLAARPRVRAIFVGTRRTDPHGAKLTFFDETDSGWPSFMRVHPVIDWHYKEIWGFIRALEIPYCPLYDRGYTSLGGTNDTHPNPALRREDVSDAFRPAYELIEDDEERLGRDR